MEVWILRGTDPETLEEKINKQLEEIEKVKITFSYANGAVPNGSSAANARGQGNGLQGGVFSNGCSRSKTVIPGS